MSFINSIIKINKKPVYELIKDKQNEMSKAKGVNITYPVVIEKLLEELIEFKNKK